MPEFIVLYRRADHADAEAFSVSRSAEDIDKAARQAIETCPSDEYVCAVWQADTPAELLCWHIGQHGNGELAEKVQ